MDWGTPDWRDLDDYGYVEGWSEKRWRWEFLRRRDEYRRDFEEVAAPIRKSITWSQKHLIAHAVATGMVVPESELGVFTEEERGRLEEIAFEHPDMPGFSIDAPDPAKYGMYSLLNPAIGESQVIYVEFAEYDGFEFGFPEYDEHELTAVTFDRRMPLKKQLEKAREYLIGWADEDGEEDDAPPKRRRNRKVDRISALRAIDAKEQEPAITWKEMTEVLWPGQDKAPSRAQEAYERGCRLRDKPLS
ncbi:hypothetical protein JCR33_19405 [Acuticoccus sp. 2012]|uniref:Transcriptional regulator-like domain-containing protein n=2 Tax=Acuticoccus mangrovi TaxID=2796142 RepID=A0A934MJ45_9HYPH|nr:hypothetical protein [Acuticoccus mangrovi]